MIFSKFVGKSAPFFSPLIWSPNSLPFLGHQWVRKASSEIPGDSLAAKVKFYKKIFAGTLFASTLLAVYLMRKKKDDSDPRLPGARKVDWTFGRMKLITYKDFSIPEEVIPTVKTLKDFEFREDDIVITSFPKTGITWLQEIVWLIANDLDFDTALTTNLEDRFPFFEWPLPGINEIKKIASPRFIKTHLPPKILFKPLEEGYPQPSDVKPKVIIIFRNPYDVAVSYYFFATMNRLLDFRGVFDTFLLRFITGKLPYGPIDKHYLDVLRLQKVLEEDSTARRVLVVMYEDLHFHFNREIDRICDFLGKPRLDSKQIEKLRTHCSFKFMSVNPMVNYEHWDKIGLRDPTKSKFFRAGEVGNWQDYMDDQQIEHLGRFTRAHFGGLIDFKFGDEALIKD